jgi:TPR repeat protein
MHYIKLASVMGDWLAMFQLGVMLFDGIGCDADQVRDWTSSSTLYMSLYRTV